VIPNSSSAEHWSHVLRKPMIRHTILSGLQYIFSLKCFAIAFFFDLIVPQEMFFFFCVLQLKKRLGTTVNNQEISAFAD
jgi:hypothetical protein